MGRRHTSAAASHLTDHVVPCGPTRQGVLSIPFGLRLRLAFDRALCGQARTLFVRAVIALKMRRAAALAGPPHVTSWAGGAATWTQRLGDGRRLNVPFSRRRLGGCPREPEEKPPRFVAVPTPTPRDLRRAASKVIRGIRRRLADLDRAGVSNPERYLGGLPIRRQSRQDNAPYLGGPHVVRLVENNLCGSRAAGTDDRHISVPAPMSLLFGTFSLPAKLRCKAVCFFGAVSG